MADPPAHPLDTQQVSQLPPEAPEPANQAVSRTVPIPLLFEKTYQPIDQAYAEKQSRQAELEWQRMLQQERTLAGEEAPAPATTTTPPEAESALKVGVESGAMAAADAARNIVDGLLGAFGLAPSPTAAKVFNVPAKTGKAAEAPHPLEAAKQIVMNGLLQFGFSPIIGGFAAARQALKNAAPDVEETPLATGFAAAGIRGALEGTSFASLPQTERQRYLSPLTVGEVLETVGPLLAPAAAVPVAKGVKKAAAKVKEAAPALASERGAIGPEPPPEPAARMSPEGRPELPPPAEAGKGAASAPERPATPAEPEMRLNLGRIETTEQVKALMAEINTLAGEKYLKEHRKPKSHAETVAESEASTWTLAQMLMEDPETILVNEARANRLRNTYVAASEYHADLYQRALAGDQGAYAQLDAAFAVQMKLAALDEGLARNLARGLEMRKELAIGARAAAVAAPVKILELGRRLKDIDPMLRGARMQELNTPQRRSVLMQMWHGFRAGKDLFHEAWIQGLLTNPATHTSNLGGTGLNIGAHVPERFVAEWVNVLRRDPEGVQRGETARMLRSSLLALEDGVRLAGKTWKTGEEAFGPNWVEHPPVSAAAYGFDPNFQFGRTIDTLGGVLRARGTPTHFLLTEDAFMKGVAYRLEISALAQRDGMVRGLTGKALEQHVTKLEAKPEPWMIEEAQAAATLRTLNAELGPTGQTIMRLINMIPGGRLVVPFLRTPTNSAKWFAQRTIGLNLVSAQNWRDIRAGGAAKDMAIARMLVGSAVSGIIAWQVADGTITGDGTINPQLRRMRRDPERSTRPINSFIIGGQGYGYNAIQPLGGMIGTIATFAELRSQIPDRQHLIDEWMATGEAVSLAAGQVFVHQTAMQGLANALEAIRDPDRNAHRVAAGFARSLVPAGVRAVTRQSDDNLVREARGLVDAFKSGLPYFNQGIPVDRDPIDGEPIHYPPGWGPDLLSRIPVATVTDDPVRRELWRHQVPVPRLPYHLNGSPPPEGPLLQEPPARAGVPITDEQRDRWYLLMTQEVKDRAGRTLPEALAALVASPIYGRLSDGPDNGKSLALRGTIHDFKARAVLALRREFPELDAQLKARDVQQMERLLPTDNPRSPQYSGAEINRLLDTLRR